MECSTTNRLCIWGLGIAIGIAWAIGMFVAGITSIFGWGNAFVEVMGSLYIGYTASFIGAIIGTIWGFVDGFIFGVLVAFFYNLVGRCCCRK